MFGLTHTNMLQKNIRRCQLSVCMNICMYKMCMYIMCLNSGKARCANTDLSFIWVKVDQKYMMWQLYTYDLTCNVD